MLCFSAGEVRQDKARCHPSRSVPRIQHTHPSSLPLTLTLSLSAPISPTTAIHQALLGTEQILPDPLLQQTTLIYSESCLHSQSLDRQPDLPFLPHPTPHEPRDFIR